MIAIDANVLIYSFDDSTPAKHVAAVDFLFQLRSHGENSVLMWQVACETLSWLRRRKSEGVLSDADVTSIFQRLLGAYPLIFPSAGILELTFDLRCRHSLSHWDSLLLGACISAGVDTLYSEDMSHGATYDSVTVLNPFQP